MDQQDDDDDFTLQNIPRKPAPPEFETIGKGKQGLLLRGLMDCPGQQDLFPDMTAN